MGEKKILSLICEGNRLSLHTYTNCPAMLTLTLWLRLCPVDMSSLSLAWWGRKWHRNTWHRNIGIREVQEHGVCDFCAVSKLTQWTAAVCQVLLESVKDGRGSDVSTDRVQWPEGGVLVEWRWGGSERCVVDFDRGSMQQWGVGHLKAVSAGAGESDRLLAAR